MRHVAQDGSTVRPPIRAIAIAKFGQLCRPLDPHRTRSVRTDPPHAWNDPPGRSSTASRGWSPPCTHAPSRPCVFWAHPSVPWSSPRYPGMFQRAPWASIGPRSCVWMRARPARRVRPRRVVRPRFVVEHNTVPTDPIRTSTGHVPHREESRKSEEKSLGKVHDAQRIGAGRSGHRVEKEGLKGRAWF